jgi:CRP-like cAMP-binding protein
LPVAALCSETELDAGEVLFHEGDIGDALYVIVHGIVVVERDGEVLATFGDGECVGEMAVLDWEPRSATVVASEPTRLIRLDRVDLLDLLGDQPPLVDSLASVLAARLRRTRA